VAAAATRATTGRVFVDRASHETTSTTMVRTDGDFDSGDSDYTWLERDDFSSKRHHAQIDAGARPFARTTSRDHGSGTAWHRDAVDAKVNP
jgi:hypothetical protein